MSPIHNNHSSTMYEPPVIDLENKNSSHTLLIELAGENNTILEIGTSTGYISKILKERGNTVTGIEIDPEAGELAQQHCDQVIIGDIETLDLDAHLTPSSFDVILLGDVLEHLVSPGVALRKLQPYLKPEGYLAISLPNVCHGDVILQMLRGDFKYTSMGLLDVTHLRFFGLRNIIDLMARSGYAIHLIQTTTHYVGGTELRIDHTTLPEDLINFLKSIPNSTVYQFIIKAELLKPWDRIDPVPEPDLAALFNEAIAGRIHEEKLPLIQELQGYKSQISGLHEAVNSLEQVVNERDYKLNESSNKLMQLSYELNNMKKSLVWRFLMKFHYGVVERIFPGNSRRRNCYELGLQGGRIIADDGFRSFLKQTSFYLQSTKEMGFENKSNCEFQYSMPEYKFCACKELNKPESTFSGFIRGRGIYIGIDNIPFSIPANTKLISINLEDRDFNDIFEKINQGESLDFCIFSDLIDAKNVPAYREYLKLLKTGGMLIILNKNHTPSFSIEMIHSLFEDTYTLIKEDFYTPNFEKTNGESNEKIQQTNNRSFKAYIIEKTNYIDRITEILQESNTWEDSNLNSLDIIIPVYNAYNDLLRCLYSIVVHQNNYRIILINDCSTDERIGDLFQKLNSLQSGKLTLLENKENLGFVKTVNIGMKHSINDVILLNSDTIVTRGWAEKMLRCAYSNPLIGTVTPFTNNGTICSVPNFCTENDIPAGFTIDNFARYIEEVSLQHYPTIPTAVGFCMYIKRDVLDKIGYFDEESFGKGYGEENDFCMRAKNKGYIHALCDDTFVFHKGEASFSEQKNELIHKNLATLTVKYPEYLPIVHSFINLNPLQELHLNIQKRITTWDQHGEKKRILYILHTWGGGTEKHVKDLINALHDTYVFFVLQVEERCLVLTEINNHQEIQHFYPLSSPIPAYSFEHYEYETIFLKIINSFKIDLIHIHQMFGHPFDIARVSKSRDIPLLYTVHDFYAVCPNINLLDCNSKLCMYDRSFSKCDICLSISKNLQSGFINQWRSQFENLFECCDTVIAPSESAASILSSYYPGIMNKVVVIEHGTNENVVELLGEEDLNKNGLSSFNSSQKPNNGLFHIAYIGGLGPNKGRELLYSLSTTQELSKKVKWSVFGITDLHSQPGYYSSSNLSIHGLYQDFNELRINIEREGVNLIIFPAIWPETFSYTLSEAWTLGIPVLVSNLGALKDRVERHGGGWVVNNADLYGFKEKILEILNSPEDYSEKKKEVMDISLRSIREMADDYRRLYSEKL